MDRLWAPWRGKYVTGESKPVGCVFCAAAAATEALPDGDLPDSGPGELVLARGEHVLAILNRYPYNNGHLMVVPYVHASRLAEVCAEARSEMMEVAAAWTEVLTALMRADGFNVGFNLGAAAGAGLADHLHLHIVPRWQGDTNLMPVVGGVKVVPEALDTSCARLRAAWRERQTRQ